MATLIALDGVRPTVGADVFLAPTAVLAGDVRIGDRASVWFGAVLRGDSAWIEVGADTSIQDNAVVHCATGLPTVVGARVTVGHGAMLEGCVVEDDALIGMGAIVLQRASVGSGALLAAGAVLSERRSVGSGMLAAGVPAVEKRPVGADSGWREATAHYGEYRRRYLRALG